MPAIWDQFKSKGMPAELVDKLSSAYTELKDNYYMGRLRPSELEAGHLAEGVIRILQWATGGLPGGTQYTPLGTKLPAFEREVQRLGSLSAAYEKSLRVHIPRVLLSVYDIRNSRGVGHLSGSVDPNLADATLVTTSADWVLAELVRLFHGVSVDAAQALVNGLVERKLPVIEMFGTFPKVLRSDLSNPMKALAILYNRGTQGASSADMGTWLQIAEKDARKILRRHDEKALVHYDKGTDTGVITRRGIAEVERQLQGELLVQ